MEICRERQQRGVSVHELNEHKARVDQYKLARYHRKEQESYSLSGARYMGGLDSVSSVYARSEGGVRRSTFQDPILAELADKKRARHERLLKKENYEYFITH
jgi:hypothetical protein